MRRIDLAFAKKRAYIGYLTAGDGDSKQQFLDLIAGGVNLVEIGIPFSDPIADGPTIQGAMKRSLSSGTTIQSVLQLTSELRAATEVPIILFTYFNPIQKDLYGFLKKAKQAGADGILIVDLCLEESDHYRQFCDQIGLAPIFVIAPSTPNGRIGQIAAAGRGFLYYACRKGTTGAKSGLPSDFSEKIAQIRSESSLPIAVGFGVSTSDTAQAILQEADGFIVGSYFIDSIQKGKKLKQIVSDLI